MVQREKRYVAVDVRFSTEGRLRPLQIIFDKGQVYKIDKIKDICRRAADVGGVGDRYTCRFKAKSVSYGLKMDDGLWQRRWSTKKRINDLSLLYFFAVARPHSYYKVMGVFLSSSSTKVFHVTTRLASGFRNTKRPGSRVSCRAEN